VVNIIIGKVKYDLNRLSTDKRYLTTCIEVRRKKGGISELPVIVTQTHPLLKAGYRIKSDCSCISIYTYSRGVTPYLFLTDIVAAPSMDVDTATLHTIGKVVSIGKKHTTPYGICLPFSIKSSNNFVYCKAYGERCNELAQTKAGSTLEVLGLLYPRAFEKNLQKRNTIELSVIQAVVTDHEHGTPHITILKE